MKITESQLRRIIRQTIVEEIREKALHENVMQKIAARPMILFGLMMALSGCTGKSIEPQDTQSQQAQIEWVEDAAAEPETFDEAVKRINGMEGVSAEDKEMLIQHLKDLEAIRGTRKVIQKAVSPMDGYNR